MSKWSTLAGHPRFYELLELEAKLHSSKNQDYAKEESPLSNFYLVAESLGIKPSDVALMHIATKYFRIVNLSQEGRDPMNESKEDTLSDMAIYAKIMRILLEEEAGPLDAAYEIAKEKFEPYARHMQTNHACKCQEEAA